MRGWPRKGYGLPLTQRSRFCCRMRRTKAGSGNVFLLPAFGGEVQRQKSEQSMGSRVEICKANTTRPLTVQIGVAV